MSRLVAIITLVVAFCCIGSTFAAPPPVLVPSDASAVAISQVQTSELIVASATVDTATALQLGTARAVTLAVSSGVSSASALLTDSRALYTPSDTSASVIAPTTLTSVPSNPTASTPASAALRTAQIGSTWLPISAIAGLCAGFIIV